MILREEGDANHNVIPDDLTNYRVVDPGDLVINKMKAWQGSLGVATMHGIVSPAYFVFSLQEIGERYAHVLLRSWPYVGAFAAASDGIRVDQWDLSMEGMKAVSVLTPTQPEQSAIVHFLDYAGLRIHRFIAAKERLVGLLEVEKRAIAHEAVSHGLDPGAPRKGSGVDLIGDVPAHWSVTRVKNEFQSLDHVRRPISATERELRRGPYDYYGASGVIDKVDSYLFDEDLLLIAEDGANLVLRNLPLAIVARGRYWVNNHAHILKPVTGQLNFMALLMESQNYRPYISGAAQPKLTQDRLFSMPIAVPPVAEQKEVVGRLGLVTMPINSALEVARRQIALLREYRTRLISDVVTGKLDVREAAKNLPDDPDADNPALDERLEEVAAG